MTWHSSTEMASGFSHNTCLPARRAATAIEACVDAGVDTTTASTEASSSISSSLCVVRTCGNCEATARRRCLFGSTAHLTRQPSSALKTLMWRGPQYPQPATAIVQTSPGAGGMNGYDNGHRSDHDARDFC